MDLVVVLTCQRPGGVSYLADTCRTLHVPAESVEWRVVSDGPLPDKVRRVLHDDAFVDAGWVAHEGPRSGPRLAHWRAFYLAVALGAENLLFFEDDVRPCRNAVRRMLEVRVPDDLAHVTFFDLKELPEGHPHAVHVVPAGGGTPGGFWSMLAMKFPRRTLEWLVRQDPLSVLRDKPETCDVALGRLLADSPWPLMGVHCPSLVEHVGDVSTTGLELVRHARNFPGHDFDAMTLEKLSR